MLDDRFGYVVSDGHGTSKVRSETSDVAITTFMPQGYSWTSLSRDVSPDGRSIAYWAPVLNGAVLHVRVAGTGADRVVFTTASEWSGNTFAWSSDSTGIAVAIDNGCQEICAVQGGTPKQELWTVDVSTSASERIATGQYFLPVAWDRARKLLAFTATGPGGYIGGYQVIDLSRTPYAIRSQGFGTSHPAVLGMPKASSDGRFILLAVNNGSSRSLAWWPIDDPQRRADVPAFDGVNAEWRPGTSEIWWSRSTELVGIDVVTGARTSLRGSYGAVVGFRVDGSAVMTSQPSLNALVVVDAKTGQGASLPVGGPFVRVR